MNFFLLIPHWQNCWIANYNVITPCSIHWAEINFRFFFWYTWAFVISAELNLVIICESCLNKIVLSSIQPNIFGCRIEFSNTVISVRYFINTYVSKIYFPLIFYLISGGFLDFEWYRWLFGEISLKFYTNEITYGLPNLIWLINSE